VKAPCLAIIGASLGRRMLVRWLERERISHKSRNRRSWVRQKRHTLRLVSSSISSLNSPVKVKTELRGSSVGEYTVMLDFAGESMSQSEAAGTCDKKERRSYPGRRLLCASPSSFHRFRYPGTQGRRESCSARKVSVCLDL
jgi:hypothetical protein